MSDKKFKFISLGVFIDEIDIYSYQEKQLLSGLSCRSCQKGPAMKPITVDFSEFVTVFGEPVGGAAGEDVFRDGNLTAPTYGAYAAQAWLKNSPTVNCLWVSNTLTFLMATAQALVVIRLERLTTLLATVVLMDYLSSHPAQQVQQQRSPEHLPLFSMLSQARWSCLFSRW